MSYSTGGVMGAIENYPMPQPALAERESAAHGAHESVRTDAVVFALVGMAAAVSWLGVVPRVGGVDVVAVAAVVGGGWGVFREAVENLFVRRMTMELSMTMALVAALAIREFTTAAFILFFVLGAEILEQMTVSRGRQALVDLAALLPRTAVVRRGSELAEAPITEVQAGDVVVIRPGAEIPVDGVVVAGESAVNQSSITGESIPVDKRPGAAVFAGTTNYLGTLDVRTERVGLDTAFGQIVAAVETAERSRAPIQKLADRLAGWIVYFALASALVTMVLTHNLRSTIAVIIAAGACGVAAGTPLAVLGAIGRSARNGAVVKGGRFMEALGKIDLVVLDKTGTLTFGEPYVTAVIPYPGEDGDRVIRLAVRTSARQGDSEGGGALGRDCHRPREFRVFAGPRRALQLERQADSSRQCRVGFGRSWPRDAASSYARSRQRRACGLLRPVSGGAPFRRRTAARSGGGGGANQEHGHRRHTADRRQRTGSGEGGARTRRRRFRRRPSAQG
jgi:Cd2+/Zn2+-exporting ATPase/Cu+-exporting ATPase